MNICHHTKYIANCSLVVVDFEYILVRFSVVVDLVYTCIFLCRGSFFMALDIARKDL